MMAQKQTHVLQYCIVLFYIKMQNGTKNPHSLNNKIGILCKISISPVCSGFVR